ncbi:SDR family NAD(P)-dependent oxidoreductase [Nocardioides sp. GCM10027113]|uniref:SDR family NAD(P)-dependent oxidoreductase n=1 Tax=unclassified Nocardioides TaxID=2615069 RepID=UPI00361CC018
MELQGARTFVAGATGALGGSLTDALLERGARVVPGGRDADRLAEVAGRCGTTGVMFDAVDVDSCEAATKQAVEQLDGLDLLVVTVGAAGFGKALETSAALTEELFAVNVLGPMSLVRAAAPHLSEGATICVLSAVLADLPTAGMADYSAAKTALSTWLGVLRRENRRRLRVLDVRPPHLDTGLDQRALGGEPPRLPAPMPASRVVEAVVDALAADATEIVADREAGLLAR